MIQVMNLRVEKVHYYPYGNLVMRKPKNTMLQIYASIADIMTYLQFHMEQVSKRILKFNYIQILINVIF